MWIEDLIAFCEGFGAEGKWYAQDRASESATGFEFHKY
jgi:hypothetical protein